MRTTAGMTVILAAALLAPSAAGGFELELREYKLMLDPEKFSGTPSVDAANQFWKDMLKPIIEDRLDERNNGEPRHKNKFELDEERIVRFFDTGDCDLDRQGYVFRERFDLKNGHEDFSKREVTLKLRTPDLFIAAGTSMEAADDDAEEKLEEDIGVLLVRAKGGSGEEHAVVADPPSMRSLFSRSVSQPLAAGVTLASLDDLVELSQPRDLEVADGRDDLKQGDPIREWVFKGAEVDLGENLDAEFALTLWFLEESSSATPAIAEISFKYDTRDGNVAPEAAQRAMTLFLAMQEELEWASPERATKTSFGLPEACAG